MIKGVESFFSTVKVQIFLFCLVVFTLPLKHNFNSISIILLLIFSLGNFYVKRDKIKLDFKNGKWLILFFSVGLLAMIYTENNKIGFQHLTKILPLLVFPIAFSIVKFQEKQKNKILWVFCISCLIASIFLFIINLYTYSNNPISNVWYYSGYTENLDIHPAYYILFLIFNVFFLFEELLKSTSQKKTIMISIFGLVFLIQILFLQSRIGLISFFITSLIYFSTTIRKIRKKYILVIFLLVSISLLIAYYFNFLNRFVAIPDSINERVTIWQGWWNVFRESPFFGYGTGDAQQALDQGNYLLGNDFFIFYKYNTHNQYLDILLRYGIAGFSVFLLMLFQSYKIAYQNRNALLLIFLILICIFFLTENILQRQHGIVFFSFFYLLLSDQNFNEK